MEESTRYFLLISTARRRCVYGIIPRRVTGMNIFLRPIIFCGAPAVRPAAEARLFQRCACCWFYVIFFLTPENRGYRAGSETLYFLPEGRKSESSMTALFFIRILLEMIPLMGCFSQNRSMLSSVSGRLAARSFCRGNGCMSFLRREITVLKICRSSCSACFCS